MTYIRLAVVTLTLIPALLASACTPIGMAAGAGASLGVAAAQEGGISNAANDLRIKTLINEKWLSYKVDTFAKLNTTVDQGRVLITGVVQNPDDRVEAVRLAWQVKGVKQVINEIRVAGSEGVQGYVKDNWITTRLRTAITFDRDIASINYSIDTVQGTVYLMGVAQNQRELDKVIKHARTIPGVKQVISYAKPVGQPVESTAAFGSGPPDSTSYTPANLTPGPVSSSGGGGATPINDMPQDMRAPSNYNDKIESTPLSP